MKLTGEQKIKAPRDIVFAALNDPEILQRIAGAEAYVLVHAEEGFDAQSSKGFPEVTLWEN